MSTSEEPSRPAEPESRPDFRIGDREREQTVAHLGTAFAEGRLDLAEYDERVATAYAAKTAGDLLPLTADLPNPSARVAPASTATSGAKAPATATPDSRQPHRPRRRAAAQVEPRMPGWLRAAWLTYATAVSINLVIWLIVGVSSGWNFPYFWPIWVAGPWGVILAVRTFGGRLAGPGR